MKSTCTRIELSYRTHEGLYLHARYTRTHATHSLTEEIMMHDKPSIYGPHLLSRTNSGVVVGDLTDPDPPADSDPGVEPDRPLLPFEAALLDGASVEVLGLENLKKIPGPELLRFQRRL